MAKDIKVKLYSNSKQFNNEMSSITRQMKVVKSEFEANKTSVDNWGNHLKQSEAKVKFLNQTLDLQKRRVNELRKAYNDSAATKGKDAKETQNLAVRLNNANAALNKTKNQLTQTTTKMNQLHAATQRNAMTMKQFGEHMNNAGMKMRSVGMGVGIVTGVAFAGLTREIKKAYDATVSFDAGMSKVQAISGATAGELKKLDGQAQELGRTTMFTATQATEGMEKLALAGWKPKAIMEAMPGMLDLAAAGALELSTAADITSDTMQAFQISANKAGHAADVFAYAQANANTNVEQMGEAMKYIAPTANSLGWSLEEASAIVMKLADNGLKGSMATQAFGSSLVRLASPTPKATKLMKKLGMEFFDANNKMKSMPEVVAEMEKGLKGLSDKQKAAAMDTLVGKNAFKQWQIVLKEGSGTLKDLTVKLENADGAAKKMAETMMDNTRGKVIQFKSAIEGLQISLTRHLTPSLNKLVDQATEIVRGFTDLDEATQGTIAKTIAMTTAVIGVTSAVGLLTAGIGALLAFTGPVGLAIVGGTALLGALGVALYAAETHTKNLAKAQEKAKEEAVRYGDGLSEGTKKGVKGYVDLYEGAKLKMLELKNMSGEEAEKTKGEIVKAFQDMGSQVVSVLEAQKEKIANTIYDIYGVAGDAHLSEAEKISKKAIELVDKDIAKFKKASETVAKITAEYGSDMTKMPPKIAKSYQESLDIMNEGSRAFAATQEEMRQIQKNLSERDGKIMAQEAEGYLKRIGENYRKQVESANEFYNTRKTDLDKHLALYPEFQNEYDKLMLGLQAKTDQMIYEANSSFNKSTKILESNLDDRGKLIDIATRKELEREKEKVLGKLGAHYEIDEADENYYKRWKERNDKYLIDLDANTKASAQQFEKQLIEFKKANGESEEEARRSAKKIVEGSIAELEKGDDKAKVAGKKKGDAHKKGIEETKEGNKKAGSDITKSTDQALSQNKESANKHGKEKGDKHKQGLESTKGANQIAAYALSGGVSTTLGKTTDGGGGSKAGLLFKQGISSQSSAVSASAKNVASSGESGLRSVKTSSAGSDFVAGFKWAISNGNGSVWKVAWSLGKSALSALKQSIDSHSPSKETEKEGKNYAEGMAVGINKNSKKVSASAKAMAAAAQKATSEKINNLQVKFDTKKIGASTYIAELKKIQKTHKLTGDQARKIQKEIYKANQVLRKEAEANQKSVDKINKGVQSANSAYFKKVKSINDKLKKDIKKVQDDYKKELANRAESIYNQTGLFSEVKTEKVDGNKLLGNIKDQNKQFKQWQSDLDKIQKSGVSQKFVDELRSMGVGAADEITAIANLPKSKLKEYVAAWKEKHELANKEAETQMAKAKEIMEKQIKNLNDAAKKELDQAKTDWVNQIKKFGDEVKKLGDFKNSGKVLGKQTVSGLVKGLGSMKGPLEKEAKALAKTIEKTVKETLKIKSPSRLMEKDVAPFVPLGLAKGIKANLRPVLTAAKEMAKSAIPDFSDQAFAINAAAHEIKANKDMFVVVHQFKSGSLEQKVEGLERTIDKLTDFLGNVLDMQQTQIESMAERDIIVELDGREVGRGVYPEVTRLQKRSDSRVRRTPRGAFT
ncbi:phage tail tape measure protein [Bacillus sp. FJAT-49732]|uniref:Phage tail tape measure protein n=1 Tax=Lederbergia citrisecunda TaxID=2833583 RepID=A0A942YKI8_9BACI|nr:phage tail tape measure protein [Lederbergia citrisecunda]MBS4198620.1 phage tail tape measure protein [Lederbergia citrisecunda]